MKRGLVLQRFLVCAVAAIASFESADLRAEAALDTSSTDVATESPRTNSAGLDEIVVTARRRSEDNQQAPIAITTRHTAIGNYIRRESRGADAQPEFSGVPL